MGFDINNFNSLISNLGQASAKMQKKETHIDSKSELNAFVSGWDAIKSKAESSGASIDDINILEDNMKSELSSLMGAEFGKTAGVNKISDESLFTADEISLENMMSLLEPEDGLDIAKLREYNKKPVESLDDAIDGVYELTNAGFDNELVQVLMDETPGAIKHITNSIKQGQADRIRESIESFDGLAQNDEKNLDILGWIQYDAINRKA